MVRKLCRAEKRSPRGSVTISLLQTLYTCSVPPLAAEQKNEMERARFKRARAREERGRQTGVYRSFAEAPASTTSTQHPTPLHPTTNPNEAHESRADGDRHV